MNALHRRIRRCWAPRMSWLRKNLIFSSWPERAADAARIHCAGGRFRRSRLGLPDAVWAETLSCRVRKARALLRSSREATASSCSVTYPYEQKLAPGARILIMLALLPWRAAALLAGAPARFTGS